MPSPAQILAVVAELSAIPLETLRSPTQLRQVGQVRAAAAHLLRTEAGLEVKEVAPLLGRSDQTVSEFSRKARLALANGGKIADLIEQARRVLDESARGLAGPPIEPTVGEDEQGGTVSAVATCDIAARDSSLVFEPVPRPRVPPGSPPRTLRAPHLTEWRRRTGLTQPQLARRSGIARETIARIENGRPARRDLILRLADTLLLAPSVPTATAELDALTGEAYTTCWSCGALRRVQARAERARWNKARRRQAAVFA
jgi:transcriptional regulator with XRE-family HTH domain